MATSTNRTPLNRIAPAQRSQRQNAGEMSVAIRPRAQHLDPDNENVLADLEATGTHIFQEPLDAADASKLLGMIKATRMFDHRLFLSEEEFDANPEYKGVNPRPGRNLLEQFENELSFVERAPLIVSALAKLLGDDYEIINKKIVCGIPEAVLPDWVKSRVEGAAVNNLGAFIAPKYRDITYFYGIDFHQDIIDFKDRDADFLTLYIYLHPVSAADSPLFLLEGSHILGATTFPHDLRKMDAGQWEYGDRQGGKVTTRQKVLTGSTGFAAIWHACTLHGPKPDVGEHERISLRYLVGRRPGSKASIDSLNAKLKGPLSLATTRVDLAADGSAKIRSNTVSNAV